MVPLKLDADLKQFSGGSGIANFVSRLVFGLLIDRFKYFLSIDQDLLSFDRFKYLLSIDRFKYLYQSIDSSTMERIKYLLFINRFKYLFINQQIQVRIPSFILSLTPTAMKTPRFRYIMPGIAALLAITQLSIFWIGQVPKTQFTKTE